MATIVIKDLPENVDLDREAMRAVIGGARLRGASPSRPSRPTRAARPAAASGRQDSSRRPSPSVLFK
ncbi:MAG: hypothetical protein ROZ37_14095 [Aromatoleum sp.]|jgi:hypothetical protein|uniref:hypothetical protein n=1 Tax=Aromatoleum sp. TaxID=2307007 RepID=UPI0028940611|nr:hypothetical protein [Aromatoleum sp.]MDT3671447.1 hypothetical protein [Aromatoleum sp.]